ncbi:hypothetical protein Dimus_019862 [Dionaea muscipula]
MERQRWTDSKVYTRKSFKGLKTHISLENSGTVASHDPNSGQEQHFNRFEVASDDSSSLNRLQTGNPVHGEVPSGNGPGRVGFLRVEDRVLINLPLKSKKERRELRRKLESELHLVRNWVRKIERNGNTRLVLDEGGDGGKLKRVHSEVGSVGGHVVRPSLNPLSIPVVLENSLGAGDHAEKEKRTPKVNPFYQSSDFIMGKDKMPLHPEQNKKSKPNGKKSGESIAGIGLGNSSSKVFKSCSALLNNLMKHKHAWVFDKPVDVKGLGLHDYFNVIKHPMDLGTVKSRLNTNWYKFPKDFADDVRLTFQNAMTFNPKGHDVHFMAEQLLKIFEDKWVGIETEYLRDLRLAAEYEASLPTPTSKMAPPHPPPLLPPPVDLTRPLERSEPMTNPAGPVAKVTNIVASGSRTPAPKKPKARDPLKRDMMYEEKQKLSMSLQSLPSEKLDNVVQIIRKRNPSLCQHDDEIEVDIDSVDTETLWELDRFVMNYRKNLSKIKRKGELAHARPEAEQNLPEKDKPSTVVEEPTQAKTEDDKTVPSPVRVEKKEGNASRSNSSSSSGAESGSSSSGESDTDSSSP